MSRLVPEGLFLLDPLKEDFHNTMYSDWGLSGGKKPPTVSFKK